MLQIPGWLDQALSTFGYVAVFVAVALESTGIPFPGETALIAAAVYAGTGRPLNIVGVIVAAAAGAITGDNTGYTVGRFGGYALVRRFGHHLHIDPAKMESAQRFFARHGDKTVFFGRFVSILRTWVAFLAGVNRMPWPRFTFWNACGGIIWAIIYGLLGFILGRNIPLLVAILHLLGVGGFVLLGMVVVAVIGGLWWRRRTARSRWLVPPEATVEESSDAPRDKPESGAKSDPLPMDPGPLPRQPG
jgi:membrane protein DedA with SNARE-associated domain